MTKSPSSPPTSKEPADQPPATTTAVDNVPPSTDDAPGTPADGTPTCPPLTDDKGQILDEDGLPVSGPARMIALAEREAAAKAATKKEQING